ncbi:hypothetical protein K280104A7_19150 [Candidatus Bariatricus faecipullorum]
MEGIADYRFLKGKKVLFLSWAFYDYPERIIEALEYYGADVTYLCSSPTTNFMSMKLFKKVKYFRNKYYNLLLKQIEGTQFDYLFLINAATFSETFIQTICEKQKEAIKILYLWDSLKVFPQAQKVSSLFDRVFTFDSIDATENEKFIFLPLFWSDDSNKTSLTQIEYDFSFVGFGHTERYNFIKKIEKQAAANNYRCCFRLYLPSLLHFLRGKYITKIFNGAKINDFVYKAIPHDKTKEITLCSRIVVDLELETQSGLTMRTIETHGLRKKLITTNQNISNYDFYNTNNILIVDRKNPIIPKHFVESSYQCLEEKLYEKYSLKHWIQSIFDPNKE